MPQRNWRACSRRIGSRADRRCRCCTSRSLDLPRMKRPTGRVNCDGAWCFRRRRGHIEAAPYGLPNDSRSTSIQLTRMRLLIRPMTAMRRRRWRQQPGRFSIATLRRQSSIRELLDTHREWPARPARRRRQHRPGCSTVRLALHGASKARGECGSGPALPSANRFRWNSRKLGVASFHDGRGWWRSVAASTASA